MYTFFFCSTKFQLLSAPGGLAVAQTLSSIFLLIIFYLFQFPSVEFVRVTADLPVFIANSDSLMVQKNKRGESLAWIFYFILFFLFILQHKGSWRVRSRVLPKHEWPTLGNVPECVLFPVHCRLQSSRPNTSPALPAITDLKASGNGRDLCHFVAVKNYQRRNSINSEQKAPKSVVIAEPRPFELN